MAQLFVARRNQRKALFLPMTGTKKNQGLIFFLPEPRGKEVAPSQLDELIRSQLEKIGITKESDVQAILTKAEEDYELRIKVDEAKREIKRLMKIREAGGKIMSVGNKKWRQVYYPAK